ncbi:RNA polymerase sigma factor [Ilumatobacter sp.]|uniref:RNA polymerase sigma factor n=1 Tax=Ilumatobacter sp. TaxID=1967498 RepID=UPI003750E6D5
MREPSVEAAELRRLAPPEIEVLLGVANSLTRHYAEGEDLVQDTLIPAHRGIDRCDGQPPQAWLLTILRNAHTNHNRKRRPELLRDPEMAKDRLVSAVSGERTDACNSAGFVTRSSA